MAMPTSASASAGASFTPSPAIATTRPARRSFSTTSALPSGDFAAKFRAYQESLDASAKGLVSQKPTAPKPKFLQDWDAGRIKSMEG